MQLIYFALKLLVFFNNIKTTNNGFIYPIRSVIIIKYKLYCSIALIFRCRKYFSDKVAS